MTTQLVRKMAKDIAGEFYEQEQRSLRFRRIWPDVQVYIAKNWIHFIDLARASLAQLLAKPDYPEHLKEAIAKDLIEDNERAANHPHAREVMQATLDYVEKDDRKFVEQGHHLPNVSG